MLEYVVGRASLHEVDSPTALVDPPKNTLRSSSRSGSFRAPREFDLNPHQSSYSLPPTPLTASFDDPLSLFPALKRRSKTYGADSNDTEQQAKETTETPDREIVSESQKVSKSVAKILRRRESNKLDRESLQRETPQRDSETPQADQTDVITPASKERGKSQPAGSQSTLHSFLMKNSQQEQRRNSISTQSEPTDRNKVKNKPSVKSMDTPASNRKPRKSMPAKLNGGVENNSESRASSRASTPHSTRSDRNPRSTTKATKTAARAKSVSTPFSSVTICRAKAKPQTNGTVKVEVDISTPKTSGSREKSVENNQTDDKPTGSASISTPQTIGEVENVTRSTRARAQKADDVMTPETRQKKTDTHDREVAGSVDGSSTHFSSEALHFDDGEMYNGLGLDGQIDGPASPGSFSTATSNGARTSGRTRKPTIRALESIESQKRLRRTRADTAKEAEAAKANENGIQEQIKPTKDKAAIAKQLFDLISSAVSAKSAPNAEETAQLEKLREEFWTKKGRKVPVKGRAGTMAWESRPTRSKPSFLKSSQTSEPWTDKDGWTHTGRINEQGEEYCFVSSDFEWYRPANTYGDKQLPEPPIRFRSHEQAEKDRVWGYPPRIGERNVPRNVPFVMEDVDTLRAMVKAREEARQRGITVDRSMSLAQIEALLAQHGGVVTPSAPSAKEVPKTAIGTRRRRRTEPVKSITNHIDSTPTTESAPRSSKRRRAAPAAPAPEPEPEPAAPETPKSPEKPKSLKLRLTFSRPSALAETPKGPGSSTKKKRPLASETEDAGKDDKEEPKSTKKRKLSTDDTNGVTEKDGAKDGAKNGAKDDAETPARPSTANTNELTPGGRPRRRAAAVMMAELHNHVEERARRAARRKTDIDDGQGQGE